MPAEKEEVIEKLGADLEKPHHQFEVLVKKMFGRSRERIDPNHLLMDALMLQAQDAYAAPAPEAPAAVAPVATLTKPSRRNGRTPIPEHLKRNDFVLDIPEEENICPTGCGTSPMAFVRWKNALLRRFWVAGLSSTTTHMRAIQTRTTVRCNPAGRMRGGKSTTGAKASHSTAATLMTLPGTCWANRVNPLAYLTDVIQVLPFITEDNRDSLLPHLWIESHPDARMPAIS